MKRISKLLAGCMLSLCLLLGGTPALAAESDTGEVMDPALPATRAAQPGDVSVGEPGDFTEQADGTFQASTQFYLKIESSPYIGPPGGGGPGGGDGDDSVRVLVPLNLPENLLVINDLPIPLAIPNTGDGSAPGAALALLAVSGFSIAAAVSRRRKPHK